MKAILIYWGNIHALPTCHTKLPGCCSENILQPLRVSLRHCDHPRNLFSSRRDWELLTYAKITLMFSIIRAAALIGLTWGAVVAQTEPTRIRVDASKASQRLFHASLTMPVASGPLTLLYPKWITGDPRPVGPIADLVGLKISSGGKQIPWTRDLSICTPFNWKFQRA